MGDILRIYSGGAQVNLYDSTNGVLCLGLSSEEISIEIEPQIVPISDGNKVQVEQIVSFEATILQTDETQIDNLMTRKSYLQEVYIVGIDSAFKMRNCFLMIKEIRSMKGGEAHLVTISGRRYLQSVAAADDLPETNYCQFIQNLLGGFGAILGAGTTPTGWSNSGATTLSIDTSHLGGGYGNEWRFTLSDSGDQVKCRLRFPIDAQPITFTASVYIDNRKGGTSYFTIGLETDTPELKYSAEQELASGADARFNHKISFIPSGSVENIFLSIKGSDTGSAELGVDNAQLEIGSLTPYVENA